MEMNMEIQVQYLGIHTQHQEEYVVDRPKGTGDWLIMCFKTPFLILTVNGIERGERGDCIVIEPHFPHYHTKTEEMKQGFINDWIHCQGDGVSALCAKYEIPVNTLIRIHDSAFFSEALLDVQQELLQKEIYYEEKIRNELDLLLLGMSRRMKEAINEKSQSYFQILTRTRKMMLREYREDWRLEWLADSCNLSVSHFAKLYREVFHISPICELMNQRIEQAQYLLKFSEMDLKVIAEKCGFNSYYYFSRSFKKKTGISPLNFRKKFAEG